MLMMLVVRKCFERSNITLDGSQHEQSTSSALCISDPYFPMFLIFSLTLRKTASIIEKMFSFPFLKRRHISVTDCCVSDLVSIELLLCTVITLQLSEGHSDEFFPLMVASCSKLLVNDTAIVTFSVLPRVKAVETPILSHFIRLSSLFLFWL